MTTAEIVKQVDKDLEAINSTYLVHRCDSPDGTLLFGVGLSQNMRAMWLFKREDYKVSTTPWTVQAANDVLDCSHYLSIHGRSELRLANGSIVFEKSQGDICVRGPNYCCKLYESLFVSVIIATADALAPLQARERDE